MGVVTIGGGGGERRIWYPVNVSNPIVGSYNQSNTHSCSALNIVYTHTYIEIYPLSGINILIPDVPHIGMVSAQKCIKIIGMDSYPEAI